MSENVKLRFDQHAGQHRAGTPDPLGTADPAADDTGQAAEAESQMRKALGLLGEGTRHRQDAMDQPGRGPERFGGGGGGAGGLHRRRFVQDGDVPVTVLRREPGHEAPANRSIAAAAAPSSSRLQRTEAALAAETAAKERAERALADVQAIARDLQTKIGHAELAKAEAIDTLRRERESVSGLHTEIDTVALRAQDAEARADAAEASLHEHQILLADERQARKMLEKTLRAAEAAREAADQLVRDLSEPAPSAPRSEPRRRIADEAEIVAAAPVRRVRPPAIASAEPDLEPEPVKWWLNPKPIPKRR